MKKAVLLLALASVLFVSFAAQAAEPVSRQLFYSRKTSLSYPKAYKFRFSLWDAETEGNMVWSEEERIRLTSPRVRDYLGDVTPLDGVDFSRQLWVQVDRVKTGPVYLHIGSTRDKLAVVPYALWSGAVTPADIVIAGANPGDSLVYNGTGLVWQAPAGGDITGVTAGGGLTGSGAAGDVTLDVGAGTGISVGPDAVGVDTAWADAQYVNEGQADAVTGSMLKLPISRDVSDTSYLLRFNNTSTGDTLRLFSNATSADWGAIYAVNYSTGSAVFGSSSSGYGIYGRSAGTGYAGFFAGKVGVTDNLSFGLQVRQMIDLWGGSYGIGVQSGTLYNRVDGGTGAGGFAWYSGGIHSDAAVDPGTGGTILMALDRWGNLNGQGTWIGTQGAGSEQAYIGGDGMGNDVQIGSRNAGITEIATWNMGSNTRMGLVVSHLHIAGGADIAEPFDAVGAVKIDPGMLLAIDPDHPGQLKVADKAYDKTVAGVASGANGINPGLTMVQEGSAADGTVPVALSGRVYAWADASFGAIRPGDMLTTSDTPGHAMKVTDYEKCRGTVVGKAMTGLAEGRGLVLILVTLQ